MHPTDLRTQVLLAMTPEPRSIRDIADQVAKSLGRPVVQLMLELYKIAGELVSEQSAYLRPAPMTGIFNQYGLTTQGRMLQLKALLPRAA